MYAKLVGPTAFTVYYFNGSNQWLSTPRYAAFDLSTGDFTIECSVNFTSVSSDRNILDYWSSGEASSYKFYVKSTGYVAFVIGNTGDTLTSNSQMTANTWYHFAVVRSGSNLSMYINGGYSNSVTNSTSLSSTQSFAIGRQNSTATQYFNGFISGIRISKSAIYTAPFDPFPQPEDQITANVNTGFCMPMVTSLTETMANLPITNNNSVGTLTQNWSAGQVLREIVYVATGYYTSATQLQVFDPVNSQIVNTVASNWQIVYPTTNKFGNSSVVVLRSQCVNSAKYKYARFVLKGTNTNEPFVEPTGGTANVFAYTNYGTLYLEMDSCTSANTSTGAVTNATYYHQSNEGYNLNFLGNTSVYLSASSRHLLMYSQYNATTNIICTMAVMEHPETNITTGANLIPAVSYRGRGAAMTVTTTSRETAAAPSYSVLQIPDGYTVSGNTKSLLGIDATTSLTTFDFSQTFTTSVLTVPDRYPTGTVVRQSLARDLFFYDAARSHNFINATTLSNVFYLPNATSINSLESAYSYSGNTYVCFPLTSSILLVPRT